MKKKLLFFLILLSNILFGQSLNHAQIKLFRFGDFENEKPAVEYSDGTRLDVSDFGEDFNESFFAKDGVKRLQTWLVKNAKKCLFPMFGMPKDVIY